MPQAGYITGQIGFVTLNDALGALYSAWENIRNSEDAVKLMRDLELVASDSAQVRMSEFFKNPFPQQHF